MSPDRLIKATENHPKAAIELLLMIVVSKIELQIPEALYQRPDDFRVAKRMAGAACLTMSSAPQAGSVHCVVSLAVCDWQHGSTN